MKHFRSLGSTRGCLQSAARCPALPQLAHSMGLRACGSVFSSLAFLTQVLPPFPFQPGDARRWTSARTPASPCSAWTSIMTSSMGLSSVVTQNSSAMLMVWFSGSVCMSDVFLSPCCERSLAKSLMSSFMIAHGTPLFLSFIRSFRISHGTIGSTNSLSSSSLSGVPPASRWSLCIVSHSSSTLWTSEGLLAVRGLWICLYNSARLCSFLA